MKRNVALASVLAAVTCGATAVWKDVPVDLGTYEMPNNPVFYFLGGPYSVTLSADTAIDGLHSYAPCSGVCYDFRNGKTLTLSTCSTIGNNIDVSFMGGTWELGRGAFFAASELQNCGGIRELWDGVVVNCGFLGISHYSYDTFVTLTNGTSITASGEIGLFCADPDKEQLPATNCWLHVTGGSKLIGSSSSSPIYVDYRYGKAHDVNSMWHVEVSGTNSEMSSRGYPMSLCVGYRNRGIAVRYSDGATGTFANHVEVGSLAAASDNALVVDSGASVKVTDYITIGQAVGADRNRLEVLDGATVDVGQYSVVNVGDGASWNSLVISNATLKGKGVVLGKSADSAYNTLHVYGTSTFTQYDGVSPFFRGAGHHNRYVIDGGYSFGTFSVSDFRFAPANGTTVGNAFEILGGSSVNCDEFCMSETEDDHDNRFFVGAGSTLNMSDMIFLKGDNDSFVVSNGTVNAYNIYSAYQEGSTGTSVRLIGPETVFFPRQGKFTFFGLGQHGEFVMDGTRLGARDKSAAFSDTRTGWSTNNTLRIVNGANFQASTLYIGNPYNGGIEDNGNTLFVGAGSTLDVSGINVTGVDNKVVISNATVFCSSGSPVVLGDESAGIAISVSGNEMVFQGERPLLLATNENRKVVTMLHNSKVRFELSGNGYEDIPLQATLSVGTGCGISISIGDDLRANIERTTRFRLTEKVELPAGTTEAGFLDGINADLPDGCYAYFSNKELWVRVKPSKVRGSVLVFK